MVYDRFSAREFNRMSIDNVRGTITKSSEKKQKLLDEANWYKSLPDELACFAPRVFKVVENDSSVSVEMELYGYPNLADSFLHTSTDKESWYLITERLMDIHALMEKYEDVVDKDEMIAIYKTKTLERLEEIKSKNPEIKKIIDLDTININGIDYKNFNTLHDELFVLIDNLVTYNKSTVVHGDYCFSNILYDSALKIFRFVDPRGRFKKQSIYGDPRYDIAKLRHSLVGLYDFIIADLFSVQQKSDNEFIFKVHVPENFADYEQFFDSIIEKHGYNTKDIKLIEGLLFLTMIPLHSDKPEHQKAFYLTTIKKLNEVIYGK